MQTNLAFFIKNTPRGKEAEEILRACVHCGFCTATCPTYQLLGDELDGPRGRIYQIKQVLEGEPATVTAREHLDRCLTCRSCETTCPSGVRYGALLDIGREVLEEQTRRPLWQRVQRQLLINVLPDRHLFPALIGLARWMRPLMPAALRAKVPPPVKASAWPRVRHERRVLIPRGCVQQTLNPAIDAATAQVLDRLGISCLRDQPGHCCGALPHHLSEPQRAKAMARANIDAWWPMVDAGIEAILFTASGCGVHAKDYGHLLREDQAYAKRATRIAALAQDPVELIARLDLAPLDLPGDGVEPIAFHPPCTLQHGQKLAGRVEAVLGRLGYTLTPVVDAHLCCGSAGTYSILQAELSMQLRERKLAALEAGSPSIIATANIGCHTHLQSGTGTTVLHWLQLVNRDLG